MSLTLYTYPGNFRAFKALIAAEYNGVSVSVPPFRMPADAKSAEFKDKSPMGKVPVLETDQGCIFESNAIARYIARIRADTELTGANFFESAQVDSWIDWCANELEVPMGFWIFPILGYMQNDPAVTGKAMGDVKKALATLERHLTLRTFMVGRQISLADIVIVSALYYPMKLVLDAKGRKAFTCVCRWFDTCINQPEFKAVLGEFTYCTEAKKAPGAAAAPAGGKKKKQKGQAQQPKKKKEAAPAAAAAAPAPAKKKGHPLSHLPKSSLVMDAWKKMVSNNPPEVAMKWFWENFDKEGYSIWFHDYNYNSDNTVMFMTSNLVEGFMQRTDELRKYAFGQTLILGEEDVSANFDVTGCFLFRGLDMNAMLEANPDAEYHTWRKVDIENTEDRAKVAAYWGVTETSGFMGKKVADWRCFK
jgi:elongation factor 1-gamma